MAMHSNWNPWHGCIKCSEGCQNCYVYYLDRMRGKNGADVYKTKTGFNYPLSRDRRLHFALWRQGRLLLRMARLIGLGISSFRIRRLCSLI